MKEGDSGCGMVYTHFNVSEKDLFHCLTFNNDGTSYDQKYKNELKLCRGGYRNVAKFVDGRRKIIAKISRRL